eukprot:Clim_evm27s152 gene=Clim_evmTU27s152
MSGLFNTAAFTGMPDDDEPPPPGLGSFQGSYGEDDDFALGGIGLDETGNEDDFALPTESLLGTDRETKSPPPPTSSHLGQSSRQGGGPKMVNGFSWPKSIKDLQDSAFAFLFVLHIFVVFAILISGLLEFPVNRKIDDPEQIPENHASQALQFQDKIRAGHALLWSCLISSAWAMLWLESIRRYADRLITAQMGLSTLFAAVACLIFFSYRSYWAGTLALAYALLNGIAFAFLKRRIEMAAKLLGYAAEFISDNPLLIATAFGITVLHTVWALFWALAANRALTWASVSYVLGSTGSYMGSSGGNVFLLIFLAFSLYWTAEVTHGIVHCTVAGTVGRWYFSHGRGRSPAREGYYGRDAKPAWDSFRRAVSYQLGSVALGGLLVASLRLAQAVLRVAKKVAEHGGQYTRPAISTIEYLLRAVQSVAESANAYAYVHVAIYGKPYWTAGRDVWTLIKSGNGLAVVITEDVSGTVLQAGCILGGLLTAGTAVLAYGYGTSHSIRAAVAFGGFGIGWASSRLCASVVKSALQALLICFIEDPDRLGEIRPSMKRHLTYLIAQRQNGARAPSDDDAYDIGPPDVGYDEDLEIGKRYRGGYEEVPDED